jgi:hypothetical protein
MSIAHALRMRLLRVLSIAACRLGFVATGFAAPARNGRRMARGPGRRAGFENLDDDASDAFARLEGLG